MDNPARAGTFKSMKPLHHPSLEDITVEGILHALSDPIRVAIFADIAHSAASKTCSTFLCVRERSIPKSTLSQHFKALRDAGLIRSERQGVEMRNTSRCGEIHTRFPGLLKAILEAHQTQRAEKARPSRNARAKSGARTSKGM